MLSRGYLRTGQVTCHDASGREIPCSGSGQDGEFKKGVAWPVPRFEKKDETVLDRLTGLLWTRNAGLAEVPVTWQEALDFIAGKNRDKAFGYSDWRLPNRRELRSLMSHQTGKPALPDGHPFENVFSGWYWTSTTAAINTAYAWYIHMEGARMFYGGKEQFFLIWPVRGRGNDVLPVTGQTECYNSHGRPIPCPGTGQDGDSRIGVKWPDPRFEVAGNTVIDRLTGLLWLRAADLTRGPVTWSDALRAAAELNPATHNPPVPAGGSLVDRGRSRHVLVPTRRDAGGGSTQAPSGTIAWRLPNINELESLVDCGTHDPALPPGHPFREVREGYWSSTTSMFEPDWAWALYLTKGAVGVGQKWGAHFSVWAVCNENEKTEDIPPG